MLKMEYDFYVVYMVDLPAPTKDIWSLVSEGLRWFEGHNYIPHVL